MRPIDIQDLLAYRFLSAIEIAPDGRHAAFIVKQPDMAENAYTSNIYLVDLPSGGVRLLTNGGKDGPFAWGLEGREIFFVSQRE